MKKLIVFAGVLFALTVILESCAGPRVPRPQRHPRYPRKMAMVTPQQQAVNTAVQVG